MVVPFINKLALLLLVSSHTTSLLPSPLKSPVPTMDQVVGTFPIPAVLGFNTVVPFISQIAILPLVACHTMLPFLPSSLQTPTPTIHQYLSTSTTPSFLGIKMVRP